MIIVLDTRPRLENCANHPTMGLVPVIRTIKTTGEARCVRQKMMVKIISWPFSLADDPECSSLELAPGVL